LDQPILFDNVPFLEGGILLSGVRN